MPSASTEYASASSTLPLSFRRGASPAHSAHARLRARSDRRRRLTQVTEALQGDLIALGYFYADLKVGTPPQTFSLIVDTGSSVTAIPCAGCRQCGQHSNPRFEPDSSVTFQHASCGGSLYCTSCSRGVCGYRVSYQEGSSYSGFLARDVIRLGLGGACVTLEFPFGCSTEETGLFTSQQADGIMGLASSRRHADQSNPTVLEALVERRLVDDVFSLCIGAVRGSLTFGMPQVNGRQLVAGEPQAEPPSLFWTYVVESTYYGVDVTRVMLGDEWLGRGTRDTATPASSIVDSGTTFMYLHSVAFAPLLARVRSKVCAGLVKTAAPKDEFCVRVSDFRLRLGKAATLRGSRTGALFDGCFDEVRVVLEGGELRMAPSQYFYASEEADEFCLGIFDNYEDTLVLGAINMMDHEVIFDRVRRRIGFYPRECAAAAAAASAASSGGGASAHILGLSAAANLSHPAARAAATAPPSRAANASLADPCGAVAPPSLLSWWMAAAARLAHRPSLAPDPLSLAMLVLFGMMLGVCLLEGGRRCQSRHARRAAGPRTACYGAELSAVSTGATAGGGGGGGGVAWGRAFSAAAPSSPVMSDEDETNSEVCLMTSSRAGL